MLLIAWPLRLLVGLRCGVGLLRIGRVARLTVAVRLCCRLPSRSLEWLLRLRGSFVAWRWRIASNDGVAFRFLCRRWAVYVGQN